MSDKFLINYTEVYSRTAQLCSRIESEISDMEATYRQCQSELHGMDGATNASLMDAMEYNQMKAKVTAEALHNLLKFIELSSRQVEQDELKIKGMFSLAEGGASQGQGTGGISSEGGAS